MLFIAEHLLNVWVCQRFRLIFNDICLKPGMMKNIAQAYGHYFDLTIVNNDIDETIR